LIKEKILNKEDSEKIWDKYQKESLAALDQARKEPGPTPESIWEFIYAIMKC